ncbi:hypothetical protein I4F81_010377 [Pyropia yezoensis]|uniref:Uncharacterized protein n=1 Tax=Pyropia yezoensis TaxID=2788 RepID=A0ACC3CCQ4_PYRYE|nr:hypothetical protein I4F81_010377 [Neopyropia yezoensis]
MTWRWGRGGGAPSPLNKPAGENVAAARTFGGGCAQAAERGVGVFIPGSSPAGIGGFTSCSPPPSSAGRGDGCREARSCRGPRPPAACACRPGRWRRRNRRLRRRPRRGGRRLARVYGGGCHPLARRWCLPPALPGRREQGGGGEAATPTADGPRPSLAPLPPGRATVVRVTAASPLRTRCPPPHLLLHGRWPPAPSAAARGRVPPFPTRHAVDPEPALPLTHHHCRRYALGGGRRPVTTARAGSSGRRDSGGGLAAWRRPTTAAACSFAARRTLRAAAGRRPCERRKDGVWVAERKVGWGCMWVGGTGVAESCGGWRDGEGGMADKRTEGGVGGRAGGGGGGGRREGDAAFIDAAVAAVAVTPRHGAATTRLPPPPPPLPPPPLPPPPSPPPSIRTVTR